MSDKRPFDDLLDALERASRAARVFGDPIRVGDLEAILVSTTRVALGLPPEGEAATATHLRVESSPLGFLTVVEGRVVYQPIAAADADAAPSRWIHEAFAHIDELAARVGRVEETTRTPPRREPVERRPRADDERDDERDGERPRRDERDDERPRRDERDDERDGERPRRDERDDERPRRDERGRSPQRERRR